MFTPEKLLEIAVANYAIYKNDGPVGQCRTDKAMEAHRIAEQAETCALWLERFNDSKPVSTIGPFGNKDINVGDVVKVKKGAELYTTHPKYKRVYREDGSSYDKLAGKDYEVKVHNTDKGWAPGPHQYHDHKLKTAVRNQMVHWAGEGGYWFWTSAENVETIS